MQCLHKLAWNSKWSISKPTRKSQDCSVLMWNGSSRLTGQENNVTPGDKSGRGKSTCSVRQAWDLCWGAALPSCCVSLRDCEWSYCWVCTSPLGSTHRWWPPPHLQSGKINHEKKLCLIPLRRRVLWTLLMTVLTHSILEGLWLHQQINAFWEGKKRSTVMRKWEWFFFLSNRLLKKERNPQLAFKNEKSCVWKVIEPMLSAAPGLEQPSTNIIMW